MTTKRTQHFDPDPDVIRSAWKLIDSHGEKALREATRYQNAMIRKGDSNGIRIWWSIGEAIKELRRTKREPHEPLN